MTVDSVALAIMVTINIDRWPAEKVEELASLEEGKDPVFREELRRIAAAELERRKDTDRGTISQET